MNVSSSSQHRADCVVPTFFSSILIIFGLFIIAQNILMIWTIKQTPKLQTNANIFVVSLGVLDMLTGANIICVGIFGLLWESSWPNDVLYTLMGGSSLGLIMGSFLHMGIIAVDRHTYIAHPYFYINHCTKGKIHKLLAPVWFVIAVLCALPTMTSDTNSNACIISTMPNFYKIYICGPLTFVVILITCTAYLRIAILSYRHRRAIAATKSALHDKNTRLSNQTEIIGSRVMKSIRFFVVMFGFFFLFSVPPTVCITIKEYHAFPETTFTAVLLLVPLNSMTNFFINYVMNNDFREACKTNFRGLHSHISFSKNCFREL